jgi:hypothetical protein
MGDVVDYPSLVVAGLAFVAAVWSAVSSHRSAASAARSAEAENVVAEIERARRAEEESRIQKSARDGALATVDVTWERKATSPDLGDYVFSPRMAWANRQKVEHKIAVVNRGTQRVDDLEVTIVRSHGQDVLSAWLNGDARFSPMQVEFCSKPSYWKQECEGRQPDVVLARMAPGVSATRCLHISGHKQQVLMLWEMELDISFTIDDKRYDDRRTLAIGAIPNGAI